MGFDAFKPILANIKNVICDSSGKWRAKLPKATNYGTEKIQKPMLACYSQASECFHFWLGILNFQTRIRQCSKTVR